MPTDPAALILMYFVVPVWIAAGVSDWLAHRLTHIEETTGARESTLHLVMLAELGLPLLAALFLQINALVIGFMIAMLLLHQASAYWDVRYAASARSVPPAEQQVHSFLEIIPLTALLLVSLRHWPQFLALFGAGGQEARWTIALKEEPLPALYVGFVLAGAAVLGLLYLEELSRCLKAARRKSDERPRPLSGEADLPRDQALPD